MLSVFSPRDSGCCKRWDEVVRERTTSLCYITRAVCFVCAWRDQGLQCFQCQVEDLPWRYCAPGILSDKGVYSSERMGRRERGEQKKEKGGTTTYHDVGWYGTANQRTPRSFFFFFAVCHRLSRILELSKFCQRWCCAELLLLSLLRAWAS